MPHVEIEILLPSALERWCSEKSLPPRSASVAIEGHLPINHVCHVATLAEELHHLLARPCLLRPPRFRFRVLLKPTNCVSVERKIHLSQTALRDRKSVV